MQTLRQRILAIGPIPPPITGFAVITERMIALLRSAYDVTTSNVSPPVANRGLAYHFGRAARILSAAFGLVAHARKVKIAYIACDGDGGLIYTAFLTAIARALGYRIFLHHHSFGYIDTPRNLMGAVLRAGGDSLTHIFLCETMAEAFRRSYPGPLRHTVVSNAAFVPPNSASPGIREHEPLTVGLLSNLNRAKGLHTFLALLEEAKAQGLPLRGMLAGPLADPADAPALDAARVSLGDTLTYLGPVQGASKEAFFADIDVFVFPTTYANEAQPTVLYEALAAGCLVVSHDRGCIRSQVGEHGLVVARDENFIAAALPYLSTLASDRPSLATKRRAAEQSFRRLYVLMQNGVIRLWSEQS